MRFSLAVTIALAPLAVTIAVLAPAGVASGSTISLTGTTLDYQAAPKASDVIVSRFLELNELLQPVIVGDGCVPGPPISCPGATSARFDFGNKADTFRSFSFYPYTINGNGGGDAIRAAGLWNSVHGGDGRDSIWENGDGSGTVNGDDGADKLYSFEASSAVHGDANDDLVVTGAAGGKSVLSGDGGKDEVVAITAGGIASGGTGADTIVADASKAWTIDGGPGADTIKAGAGQDTVTGGDGNDVIDVSADTGAGDNVSCGNGKDDTVYADSDDVITGDCETVSYTTPALAAVDTARADAAAFVAAMPVIPAF